MLGAEAYRLFAAMPRGDCLHGLCVLSALERDGLSDGDVAAAALLHDVGKGPHLNLMRRSVVVLLGAIWPGLIVRLASADGGPWRSAFHAHLHHAALGAELCQRAGCAPATVALVRWHGAPPPPGLDPALAGWLAALRAADEAC